MDRPNPPGPGYRALRKGRTSIPGQPYLVTTICHARQPWFATWQVAAATCTALAEHHLWRGSQLMCWVLMPDHLHVLLGLGTSEPLPRLVQRLTALTPRTARQPSGQASDPVWMAGYHDRALRRDEDIRVTARYLVANPLRAGLVDRPGNYPYWDAAWLDP
jgi:REP element-mobilizing transposase RayT